MKKTNYLIAILFLSLGLFLSAAPIDSVKVEVLMNKQMLKNNGFEEKFIPALEITGDSLLLLATDQHFNLLGWEGIRSIGNIQNKPVESFAYTPEGFLMMISDKEICYFDSLQKMQTLFSLPDSGMKLSQGKSVIYLYDCNTSKTDYSLYVLSTYGRYIRLLQSPYPIQSVTECKDSVLFASGNIVFNFNKATKAIRPVAALPKGKIIKSVTSNDSNTIYFSTDSAIYAQSDTNSVVINSHIGGIVRYFAHGLVIFNPEEKLLIRIPNIDNMIHESLKPVAPTITQPEQNVILEHPESAKTLTNTDIKEMAKQNMTDGSIISKIFNSEVNFSLTIDDMIDLSTNNVSSTVISVMKKVMKEKQETNTISTKQ